MIKCEVVFDGDYICCNGIEIYQAELDMWIVNTSITKEFKLLEQAITYCMEQSK